MKVDYSAIPSSPTSKRERQSSSGAAVRKWSTTLWWLEGEVAEGWGERGHWIAAVCWIAWLLFLCVHKTGDGQYHFLIMHLMEDRSRRFKQVLSVL